MVVSSNWTSPIVVQRSHNVTGHPRQISWCKAPFELGLKSQNTTSAISYCSDHLLKPAQIQGEGRNRFSLSMARLHEPHEAKSLMTAILEASHCSHRENLNVRGFEIWQLIMLDFSTIFDFAFSSCRLAPGEVRQNALILWVIFESDLKVLR